MRINLFENTGIATPGAFYFFGDIPDALKTATQQMGLQGEFGEVSAEFARH